MRREQERKKELAQREAAEKQAEAKKHGRKDLPWLQKHLIVKVSFFNVLIVMCIGTQHDP